MNIVDKKNILLGLFLLFSISAFSQIDTLKIDFCDKMLEKKENRMIQFKLVHENDTFIFPQVGDKTFINPIKYYNLSLDSSQKYISILFENTKYVYKLNILIEYFFRKFNYTKFCITGRKLAVGYEYIYGGAVTITSYDPRYKKK